ncbi:MAG TPA: hypothetical protein VIL79_08305 [Thermoleophilia bacterium]
MKKYLWVIIAVAAFVVIGAVGIGGFALGDIQSVKAMTVQRATPHQLAEAMKADRFYSDYRKSALLVTGTVASVARRGGRLIVGLQTDSSYGTSCDLGTATVAPRVGERFTVLTVGQAAERLPSVVLLHDCVVP